MSSERALQLLGLAARAGQVSTGTPAAKNSILRKKAFLLLMSTDIAGNSWDELTSACERASVPWAQIGSKFELGRAVGKAYRVAVTVNEARLAMAIEKQLVDGGEPSNSTGVVR